MLSYVVRLQLLLPQLRRHRRPSPSPSLRSHLRRRLRHLRLPSRTPCTLSSDGDPSAAMVPWPRGKRAFTACDLISAGRLLKKHFAALWMVVHHDRLVKMQKEYVKAYGPTLTEVSP